MKRSNARTYADNGSLARAQRAGEDREYVFSDRGELTQEKLNGQILAANFDPNKSGAATFRENLREFTIKGSVHPEATVFVFARSMTPMPRTFLLGMCPGSSECGIPSAHGAGHEHWCQCVD